MPGYSCGQHQDHEPGTLLTAMAKTSKPLSLSRVAKRLVPTPSPPQPPELTLPQILAAVVTGGKTGQVENLAEPTFDDCCLRAGTHDFC